MRKHWLDTMPPTMGLRAEELQCRPGDTQGALRIRDLLRDYLDNHSGLVPSERDWLYRQIQSWTQRAVRPSVWFLRCGDAPPGLQGLTAQELKEERALLSVYEVLDYYEGRGKWTPAEIRERDRLTRIENRIKARVGRKRWREVREGKRKPRRAMEWTPIDAEEGPGQRVRRDMESGDGGAGVSAGPEIPWMGPREREQIMQGILQNIRQSRRK